MPKLPAPIEPPDAHHLSSALGWLGLGAPEEARLELARLAPANQLHPEALEIDWLICAHSQDWARGFAVAQRIQVLFPEEPDGWLHSAYARRRMPDGGLGQAWNILLPAADRFPKEPLIAYNLACYACQQQRLADARQWLERAQQLGDKAHIRKIALADRDLEPLWPEIRQR